MDLPAAAPGSAQVAVVFVNGLGERRCNAFMTASLLASRPSRLI
jgi:hypothetical protein